MRMQVLIGLACAGALATGCVSQGRYDECVRGAQQEAAQAAAARAAMQRDLDGATAINDQLSKQLDKLGQDSKSLLAANGELKDALESSRRRLDELRRAQAAAEARAALFHDLALRFKSMIDAGDLAIVLRQGRMVLRLPNDVLFDSGRSELKPDGKRALGEVADVLATIHGRRFQVSGHTDDQPIRLSPYKSNWDLAAARALEVTAFLIAHGVDPHVLSAAGYGEFDPVEDNSTKEGRAYNRRTEITLQPNIDEMVAVPSTP